jgi:salicylate 5-hydroxylase large subunit
MATAVEDTIASPWTADGSSRIPAPVYTSREIYNRELKRIFYGPHWSYVGLDIEVPDAGSFKRTTIGERSVIMIRNRKGEINVLENRCAHRAMRFCQERTGKVKRSSVPTTNGTTITTESCLAFHSSGG